MEKYFQKEMNVREEKNNKSTHLEISRLAQSPVQSYKNNCFNQFRYF